MLVPFLRMQAIRRLVLIMILAPGLVALSALSWAPSWLQQRAQMTALGPIGAGALAFAQDDDWDDEDEDDDDGGDDWEEDDQEEEEEGDGEPQPPVTAGGLFTLKTYPISEIERPLTVSKGMFEVRGGLQIDVSDETAFEAFGLQAEARYGLQDHVELQGVLAAQLSGTPPAVGGANFLAGFGFEGGLYYDVVHFRALATVKVNEFVDDTGATENDAGFDTVIGFPFRYRMNEQIAIIALDEFMTFHFADDDNTPDLTIGVGGIFQALPPLALTVKAEIFIPRFDSTQLTAPVTVGAQFSPNNQFDLGLEIFLPIDLSDDGALDDAMNLEIADRIANRYVLLFAQARL